MACQPRRLQHPARRARWHRRRHRVPSSRHGAASDPAVLADPVRVDRAVADVPTVGHRRHITGGAFRRRGLESRGLERNWNASQRGRHRRWRGVACHGRARGGRGDQARLARPGPRQVALDSRCLATCACPGVHLGVVAARARRHGGRSFLGCRQQPRHDRHAAPARAAAATRLRPGAGDTARRVVSRTASRASAGLAVVAPGRIMVCGVLVSSGRARPGVAPRSGA